MSNHNGTDSHFNVHKFNRNEGAADEHLCFCYLHVICNNHSTSDTQNFKTLAIFSGCTHWFISDIVRIPEDVFYGDFYDMAILHSHKSHYIENDSNKQTAFVLFFFFFFFLNKT